MFMVTVDAEKCTGCEQCVDICPEHVFEMKDGKSEAARPDDCQGCMSCVESCDDKAITVNEV